LENTQLIVDRVKPLNLKKKILLPNFPIPQAFKIHEKDELNQWEYLKHLTYEGARQRYGVITESVQERIDFELNTIKIMGFAGYFLIVSDFIRAGRDLGVFIGPGRGSAAGSAVAYCIGITNIDPIKYNLLFERFLNPDRASMPDIDTDFDDEGRQRVIEYVVQKYGKEQVAQIITYGTMAAKMSIKDVARVLDLPLSESNALAKLVPDKPGTNLGRVLKAPLTPKEGENSLEEKEQLQAADLENVKMLRQFYNGDDLKAQVLKEAERLEGSVRNTGIHAAGIIIAPKDLTELIPVATAKDSDLWVTQIEGNSIEESGVIKMDFLGLKTLSILKSALELIKENHGVSIDLDALPLDDEKTYQLYQRGETNATFQFESPGMQKHLRNLKPDQFADLIAMNALYRPGPLAYIPNFIARKHGKEPIEYDLEDMKEYLEETYGITVYQEQVMLLAQKLAGFSKGDADILRKAMGKKQKAVLDKMKAQFVSGATAKGHPTEKLEKIWADWEAFAQYAFNKSHSTCYAFVAYQTAYLKAHYPSEYMAGVLNHAGSLEKITFFMEECRRMGIKVLGPDVNESKIGFAVNKKGEIRFGLGGLKGVGEAAVASIIEERQKGGKYQDVFDFIKRVNQRTVNKKSLEALIYSGAFDCFTQYHRAQYFFTPKGDNTSGLEKIIKFGNAHAQDASNNTPTLFGDISEALAITPPQLPPCPEWSLTEKLHYEKEVTGMFMSGHPLDYFKFEQAYYGTTPIAELNEFAEVIESMPSPGRIFKLAALVTKTYRGLTRNGKNMARLELEDYSGKIEFALWSEDVTRFGQYLDVGLTLFVTCQHQPKMQYDGSGQKVQQGWECKVLGIHLLETLRQQYTRAVELRMFPTALDNKVIGIIESNLKNAKGSTQLKVIVYEPIKNYNVELMAERGIMLTDELADFLMNMPSIEVKVEMANLQ
ncbi:MAG TPA: DNA polymerase III subunit alpha, partial [Phnomibacter sp.]|nr:DNA polymerase III subunit alpha [Phnomibacter sp.]